MFDKTGISLLCLMTLSACSPSKSSTPAVEDTETTTTTEEPTTTPKAGTLALEKLTPGEVFTTLGTAITSVGQVKNASNVSLSPGTLAISALALAGTDDCTVSGGAKETVAPANTGKFVGYSAYCDLSMHPDGPDTTLGGIDRIQGVLCAMEGNLVFDGVERTLDLPVTTKCFSQSFVDMLSGYGLTSLKEKVTATVGVSATVGSTAYEKVIQMTAAVKEEGFDYTILITQKDGILASAVLDGDVSKVFKTFAIKLDINDPGSIVYEGRFTKAPEGDTSFPLARHIRVVANGTFDQTTKAFTALTKLNYLFWDVNAGDSEGSFSDKMMSVSGSPDAGFKAIYAGAVPAFASVSAYTPTEDKVLCYGGTCEGNAGLVPQATADFSFAKSLLSTDASYLDATTWFKTTGPLSFEAVTLTGVQ